MDQERYLRIGKVIKAHGIKGELKILSYSGGPDNLPGYKNLFLTGEFENTEKNQKATDFFKALSRNQPPDQQEDAFFSAVKNCRLHGKYAIVQLAGIKNRDDAELVLGSEVWVAKEDIPELAEDEFYWHQLVGFTVESEKRQKIGSVKSLFATGAHDILVVIDGKKEFLIPARKEFIADTDLVGKVITLASVPGLLEIND